MSRSLGIKIFFGAMCKIYAIMNNYSARAPIFRSKAGQENRRRKLTSCRGTAGGKAWYLRRFGDFPINTYIAQISILI